MNNNVIDILETIEDFANRQHRAKNTQVVDCPFCNNSAMFTLKSNVYRFTCDDCEVDTKGHLGFSQIFLADEIND